MTTLPADVASHYTRVSEAGRLDSDRGPLELARTQEIVSRHLGPAPLTILDVGGAAGRYACWLAAEGHQVHLVDALALHVEQALAASAAQPERPLASARVGDARRLDHEDASVDAVLLLGPLYHLTERADRLAAIREARRVLRSGGLLFAAGISRFASLLDGLVRDLLSDPDFETIVERDLRDGQHRNPTARDYFTTAFFHLPSELAAEVTEAGFSVVELVGVEGPGWVLQDFAARWADPVHRRRLLWAARAVEQEISLLGMSSHLLAVGRR